MRLPEEETRARIRFAMEQNWDVWTLARAWGKTYSNTYVWVQKYRELCCGFRPRIKRRPYDGQRMFDLHILSMGAWCEAWGIPTWEYRGFLRMYERKCGHRIATPERREQWDREYWERLGE